MGSLRSLLRSSLVLLMMCTEAQAGQGGLASWYSSKECCKPNKPCLMANGEDLRDAEREEAKTGRHFVASWHYPLGTYVRVCRADDPKRCVRAEVKDRGPSKRLKQRVVDLGVESFNELEDPKKGLVAVTVTEI